MTIFAPPKCQKPYPEGHESYNIGRVLPGINKMIKKNKEIYIFQKVPICV